MKEVKTSLMNGKEVKRSITLPLDVPATVAEAVTKWGENVVLSLIEDKAIIAFQNATRRLLNSDKTDKEIADQLATWKPGIKVAREKKDAPIFNIDKFKALSPEERKAQEAAIKEQLRALAAVK